MAGNVQFEDNRIAVKAALGEKAIAFLYEASGEMVSQLQRETPVDTGQLKNSWSYTVSKEESKAESTIGSPLENAIWNEYGTGEHALNNNGRLGGWSYKDENGDWHYTVGKKPNRTLFKVYGKMKPKVIRRAEQIFKK